MSKGEIYQQLQSGNQPEEEQTCNSQQEVFKGLLVHTQSQLSVFIFNLKCSLRKSDHRTAALNFGTKNQEQKSNINRQYKSLSDGS